MNIRFDRLETVIEATQKETLDQFTMSMVFDYTECGTAGCLIGNYNVYIKRLPDWYGEQYDHLKDRFERDWEHFGINCLAYTWLFDSGIPLHISRRKTDAKERRLKSVTKEQAISRVQKFIAYFKRKQEIFADYEKARRQEGNWNVHLTVKERLQEVQSHVAV